MQLLETFNTKLYSITYEPSSAECKLILPAKYGDLNELRLHILCILAKKGVIQKFVNQFFQENSNGRQACRRIACR